MLGGEGQFLSCFPLESHFMWLKNVHKPPIDTIKFGKFSPNKDKYVYSYSRRAFITRRHWFKQIRPEMLLKCWISQKKQEARDYGVKIGSHSFH